MLKQLNMLTGSKGAFGRNQIFLSLPGAGYLLKFSMRKLSILHDPHFVFGAGSWKLWQTGRAGREPCTEPTRRAGGALHSQLGVSYLKSRPGPQASQWSQVQPLLTFPSRMGHVGGFICPGQSRCGVGGLDSRAYWSSFLITFPVNFANFL